MLAYPGVHLEPYEGGYVFAQVYLQALNSSPELYPDALPGELSQYARDVRRLSYPTYFEVELTSTPLSPTVTISVTGFLMRADRKSSLISEFSRWSA